MKFFIKKQLTYLLRLSYWVTRRSILVLQKSQFCDRSTTSPTLALPHPNETDVHKCLSSSEQICLNNPDIFPDEIINLCNPIRSCGLFCQGSPCILVLPSRVHLSMTCSVRLKQQTCDNIFACSSIFSLQNVCHISQLFVCLHLKCWMNALSHFSLGSFTKKLKKLLLSILAEFQYGLTDCT